MSARRNYTSVTGEPSQVKTSNNNLNAKSLRYPLDSGQMKTCCLSNSIVNISIDSCISEFCKLNKLGGLVLFSHLCFFVFLFFFAEVIKIDHQLCFLFGNLIRLFIINSFSLTETDWRLYQLWVDLNHRFIELC